jgi:2-polyprenyl-3-methyl-5-hydroxy-6-metoxy-1,4-benzoquinol methylase
MARVLGWEVIGYLLLSAGYLAAVAALGMDAWSLALPLMGGLLLGGVAGLAAIFVPAGLGVREGTLAWVLLGSVAPPTAVMLSLISRVWLTAGEASIVTLGALVGSNHRRHAGSVRKPRPAIGGLEWYGNLADPEGRVRRANRIATALTSFGGVELFRTRLLDVGCSAGTMTNALAAQCRFVVGTDVDLAAIRYATTHAPERESAAFIVAAGEHLPFFDDAFDIVVCNHVYEHAQDPYAMMNEIWRVLRPGGWCYFAGGHTLQLIEPHYRLPFLSWLPKRAADSYLRWFKRGERYEERFLMPWHVPRLFSRFGARSLASTAMLQNPVRYELAPRWWPGWLPLRIPRAIAAVVACVAPTYIWMLRK